MNLSRTLRLALVPIGAAIAARGLQYLTDEAGELQAAIDARRAELAEDTNGSAEALPAEPKDFPPTPTSSTLENGKSSVRRPSAARRRMAMAAIGGVLMFAAGAVAAGRLTRSLPPASPEQLLRLAAPCGICGTPTFLLDAFPGHICPECWPAAAGGCGVAASFQPHTHTYGGKGCCVLCGAEGVNGFQIIGQSAEAGHPLADMAPTFDDVDQADANTAAVLHHQV